MRDQRTGVISLSEWKAARRPGYVVFDDPNLPPLRGRRRLSLTKAERRAVDLVVAEIAASAVEDPEGRGRGLDLEGLAELVADAEKLLQRLERFSVRAARHMNDEKIPCGSQGEHDPWAFFNELEWLDLDHVCTLRLLERAGRICIRRRI